MRALREKAPPHLWIRQLAALIWKEFQQIRHDPSSWLVAIVLPGIFLFLFGYGISLDAGILKIALLNESKGEKSIALTQEFYHSPRFDCRLVHNMRNAGLLMSDSVIDGIVVIRENFDQEILAGHPGQIQIIVNGAEPNNAAFIQSYSQELVSLWRLTDLPGGALANQPLNINTRYWYNPNAKSELFLVPGSITVIMTLIGTLLTSLVFSRERERGTMEALITTPVSRLQLLLGKLIPYFCMGMFSMLICVLASIWLFTIPFRGSWWILILISSIYMLSALGQGLLISVSFKSQLVCAEAGMFTGFLPALMMSGFLFDIESMVYPMQLLSKVLPATYFNPCIRTLFLVGDDWEIFWPGMRMMLLLALLLLTLVYMKLRKKLDIT